MERRIELYKDYFQDFYNTLDKKVQDKYLYVINVIQGKKECNCKKGNTL